MFREKIQPRVKMSIKSKSLRKMSSMLGMKLSMRPQAAAIICLLAGILLPGIADGSWLGEDAPDYGEVASWFSDPIFYSGANRGGHEVYYPYFGQEIFKDSVQPIRLGIGTTGKSKINWSNVALQPYPYYPQESEFRNRFLAALNWTRFSKNWTTTMDYARNKSSLKVRMDHSRGWENV